jgi:hypothetical protein
MLLGGGIPEFLTRHAGKRGFAIRLAEGGAIVRLCEAERTRSLRVARGKIADTPGQSPVA